MSHFVNTNFVFSCYFSVLFPPWVPAISFHLAVAPSYLPSFTHYERHANCYWERMRELQQIRNQNFTFPLLFFLPIFPFSSIIMISVHLAPASLYAGNFFTSYWFLRFSCSVFSMISMTIFILTHSKGKR